MIENKKEWNETLDQLQATLRKVAKVATDAISEAWMLRHYNYEDEPMQSEADYFDLCEFMEDLEKHHKEAQKLLERFSK